MLCKNWVQYICKEKNYTSMAAYTIYGSLHASCRFYVQGPYFLVTQTNASLNGFS